MTATTRMTRALRAARRIYAELDYAQRRSWELRTGVPLVRRSPHH